MKKLEEVAWFRMSHHTKFHAWEIYDTEEGSQAHMHCSTRVFDTLSKDLLKTAGNKVPPVDQQCRICKKRTG